MTQLGEGEEVCEGRGRHTDDAIHAHPETKRCEGHWFKDIRGRFRRQGLSLVPD